MKRITKTRFLSFFCRQCLHWFQVKIIIQMQVVQILTMNQQVQHVITLTANLQTDFNPVQCCGLKEFRRLERTE